jgi:hypothetical protein
MDNQHKQIKGYRDLSQDEINLMNEVKQKASEVEALINSLGAFHSQTSNHAIDVRWVNIATTDLQKGFMALVRSIAKPESF